MTAHKYYSHGSLYNQLLTRVRKYFLEPVRSHKSENSPAELLAARATLFLPEKPRNASWPAKATQARGHARDVSASGIYLWHADTRSFECLRIKRR